MSNTSENAFLLKLHSPLSSPIEIVRLHGTEELGRLFAYDLDLRSPAYDINPNDLLGKSVAVELQPSDMPGRMFHGVVTSFYFVGEAARHAKYRATIRPWLWLLTNRGTCRIFQGKTAPQIIDAVFRDAGFTDFSQKLTATYRTRDYCVQYNESDFHFVSRLMEEEGIYYFFTHEQDKHTLKLVDASSNHAATALEKLRYIPEASMVRDQFISSWSSARHLQTGKIKLNDYNFETPATDLISRATIARQHAENSLEYYSNPGRYPVSSAGGHYANMRLQERQAEHMRAHGSGIIASLVCGETFQLTDHPREEFNDKYIAVSTTYDVTCNVGGESGTGGDDSCTCALTAVPTSETYRSASLTPKSLIRGPQTALVVGPSGKEIWTDKYGRVKLHFYWDQLSTKNENSSCWVRVSQVWAGANWGAMHIPRIGQEVVVEFLEGDPDRPLVTGRVYNAAVMPPYTLPDNQTQSGIKSRSSLEGNEESFNELRFEDKKDSEQIYFHAEKDFFRVVENNDDLKIGFEKRDKGNQTIAVFNNQIATIGIKDCEDGSQTLTVYNNRTTTVGVDGCADGSQTLTVLKNRTATVKTGNESLTVETGNRAVTLDQGNDLHQLKTGNREVLVDQGNDALTIAAGDQNIKVTAGSSTLEAGTAIELKVGGSSIKIEASGITIKAPMITLESSGKLSLTAKAIAELTASGNLKISGAMVNIN